MHSSRYCIVIFLNLTYNSLIFLFKNTSSDQKPFIFDIKLSILIYMHRNNRKKIVRFSRQLMDCFKIYFEIVIQIIF